MSEDIGVLEFRVVANLSALAAAEDRIKQLSDKLSSPLVLQVDASYSSVYDAMEKINGMQKQIDDMSWVVRMKVDQDDLGTAQAVMSGLKAKMEASPVVIPVEYAPQGAPAAPAAAAVAAAPAAGPSEVSQGAAAVYTPSMLPQSAQSPYIHHGSGFLGGSIFRHYWTYNFGAMVVGRGLNSIAQTMGLMRSMRDEQSLDKYSTGGAAKSYLKSVQGLENEMQGVPIVGPVAVGASNLMDQAMGHPRSSARMLLRGLLVGAAPPLGAFADYATSWLPKGHGTASEILARHANEAALRQETGSGLLKARTLYEVARYASARASGNTSDEEQPKMAEIKDALNSQLLAIQATAEKERQLATSSGDAAAIARQENASIRAAHESYRATALAAQDQLVQQQAVNTALDATALAARNFAAAGEKGRLAFASATEKIHEFETEFDKTHNMKFQAEAMIAGANLKFGLQGYANQTHAMKVADMPTKTLRETLSRLSAEEADAIHSAVAGAPTPKLLAARESAIRGDYHTRRGEARAAFAGHARRAAASAAAHHAAAARAGMLRERSAEMTLSSLKSSLAFELHPSAEARLTEQKRQGIDRLRHDRNLTAPQLRQAVALERQLYAVQAAHLKSARGPQFAKVMDPGAVLGSTSVAQRHLSLVESSAAKLTQIAGYLEKLADGAAGQALKLFDFGGGA